MANRLSSQLERQARARTKLRQRIALIALDWHECPPEEREQMRQELASALNRLQTVVRKSNVDELMQAEQIARIEALRQEIAG